MIRLLIDRYSLNNPSRTDARPFNLVRLIKEYNLIGTIDKASMQRSQDEWQWHIAESDLLKWLMDLTGRRWFQGMYHWVDPIGNWIGQADHFLRAIDAVEPDGIFFDIEQHDGDWGIPYKRIPANRIYDATVTVVEHVKARRPDKPWMPYTAKWFLENYCPQLVPYFGNHPAWIASYIDYGLKVRHVTKTQFLEYMRLAKETPMPTIGAGVLPNPVIRQITSTQILPIMPGRLDYNIVYNDAEFDRWLGWQA